MRSLQITALIAALLGCCVSAFGQQWAKEPAAVLGVRLGLAIGESGIPRCESAEAKSDEICLSKSGGLAEAPARYELLRHPFDYADINVLVDETGVAARIMVILDQGRFVDFSAVLVERYGAPTSQHTGQWQNRAGAKFPSKELIWAGRRMRILAFERGQSIDRSVIAFEDVSAVERDEQATKKKLKGAASKL